jgi:hypothetical protein
MCMNSGFAWGFLVAITVTAGCGKAPKLPTVPVTGNVTYKGRPVADAQISFMPADPLSGKPATGVTDAQGRFTLQTHVGGSTFANGALTGEYNVTIKQGLPTRKEVPYISVAEWSKLPPEERARKGNGMPTQRPSEKKQNDAASANGWESALPLKYADVKNPVLKASVTAGGKNDFPFELTD